MAYMQLILFQSYFCQICVEETQRIDMESTGEQSACNGVDDNNESNSDHKQPSDKSCIENVEATSPSQETFNQDTSLATRNPVLKKNGSPNKMKHLIPLMKIFVPQIIFWAAFFQRSSTFILQGAQMDCYIGTLHLPPGE